LSSPTAAAAGQPDPQVRYALYLAPPESHPLQGFVARWLGYDPLTGTAYPPEPAAGLGAERIAELTAEPRTYGLHATLKPPFRLRPGKAEADLHKALGAFAARRRAFELPPLKLRRIGRFLALVPDGKPAALHDLADAAVREFDGFRADLNPQELAKRRRAPLTPRQEAYLQAWGYPYVFEEFRAHFSLTGRITDETEMTALEQHLARALAPIVAGPYEVADLCLFKQPAKDAPFRLAARFPFGPPA